MDSLTERHKACLAAIPGGLDERNPDGSAKLITKEVDGKTFYRCNTCKEYFKRNDIWLLRSPFGGHLSWVICDGCKELIK
jgi:hypothetical protein